MQRIHEIDGDWWPLADTECRPAILSQVADADEAIAVCRNKHVVIQAGGNCGIWARHLANTFKTVYTFEPDADNFLCLSRNATAKNIIKFQAALGTKKTAPISLKKTPENAGAHHVAGMGDIPVMTIDSLNLEACDFIQLDIEGFEIFALQGARRTIMNFRPVLMIEDKNHHLRYGLANDAVKEILSDYGYQLYKKVHRDIIMVPKEWGEV